MKRTLEELEKGVAQTAAALSEAQKAHRAAVDALENHPIKRQRKADAETDTLRKELPPYLFGVLVRDAPDPMRAFYVTTTCDWAQKAVQDIFEISIYWASGKHRRFSIPYYNDTLDADARDGFKNILFYPDVQRAWKEALRANNDKIAEALAALIYAAAVYKEDPEPRSTFLRSLYDNGSDDE